MFLYIKLIFYILLSNIIFYSDVIILTITSFHKFLISLIIPPSISSSPKSFSLKS